MWISVDEQLPEPLVQVLCAWKTGDLCIDFRNGDGWGAPIIGKPMKKGYTHWMPLPAPPMSERSAGE